MTKPKHHPLDDLDPGDLGEMVLTRAALKAYDSALGRMRAAQWSWRRRRQPSQEAVAEAIEDVERAERALGRAFADDTRGKLDRAFALRQGPCQQLRKLLKLCAPAPIATPKPPKPKKPRKEKRPVMPEKEHFVLPVTKAYAIMRGDALDRALSLRPLGKANAAPDRRHERDDCEKYHECLERAALTNAPALPCGQGPKGKRAGCPKEPVVDEA